MKFINENEDKMKLITNAILIAILCFAGQMYFPWWIVIIVAFLIGFLMKSKSGIAFFAGFIGVGSLWFLYATYLDIENGRQLTRAISALMGIDIPSLLIVATTFIGATSGALGAWTGNLLRKLTQYF